MLGRRSFCYGGAPLLCGLGIGGTDLGEPRKVPCGTAIEQPADAV